MSKKWYPVINYENCIECGACVDKCSHGVYEKGMNKPNVIYTDGCVEGCRGCQKLCPVDAIEYVGDTGSDSGCDCGCSCNC
ncbi:MAG: 4Fe-4S binding protein [Peptococcaceae bacterium]|nr:4Fe-4S binding protein [Peptococcaceae bacterium]